MAIEDLKQNIKREKELVKEITFFYSQAGGTTSEAKLVDKTIKSLTNQFKIINNSIPELVNSITLFKKLKPEKEEKAVKDLEKMSYADKEKERVEVTVGKPDKKRFLEELSLSEETLKRLRKKGIKKPAEEIAEFRKPGFYSRISNRIFRDFSSKLEQKSYFKRLNLDLRKSNMPYLLITYLSMGFFTTLISLIFGILAFIVLALILGIGSLKYIWIIPVLPIITLAAFYFFPAAERKNIESQVDQEIPFVTIHMSAIAGSGIEPSQIFKIIATGEEYPNTKKEFKKIINQVNVYGYDLVTALKNTAKETPSKKLSELLNGIASAISGGSSLTDFLNKRAETLLFEYKIEREKRTKSAETFMDIYISIMIVGPMIMMLLLILISMGGITTGLSITALTTIIILLVALVNIIFLVFLYLRQPK